MIVVSRYALGYLDESGSGLDLHCSWDGAGHPTNLDPSDHHRTFFERIAYELLRLLQPVGQLGLVGDRVAR